jgi:hypothetical protein
VGFTVSGSTLSFYLNGALVGTGTFNNVVPSAGTHMWIGAWNGGANNEKFDGKIDDVKIWNRALNAAEMSALYKQAGPVGWWKLDESSGTTASDQQTNNPGTLTNGPTWAATGGKINGALGFDGTNDYVAVSNGDNFDFEYTQPMTISAWVNRTSNTSEDDIFEKWNTAGSRGYGAFFNPSDDHYYFTQATSSGAYNKVHTTSTLSTGTWYHVVATSDGSGTAAGMKLYVDGVQAATTVDANVLGGGTIRNSDNPGIGAENASGTAVTVFHGSLDDVRVYDRTLSLSEVKGLFNQGKPSGLVAWYKMDETSGNVASDSSGNGFNATATDGTPAVWLPTNGTVKGAGYFNGYLDFVAPETGTTALDFANGSTITLSFWAQPSISYNGTQEILFKQGGNYFFEFDNGLFTFGYYNGGWQTWASSYVQYFPFQWTHYAVTYTFGTGSSAHVYVNGAEITGSWVSGGSTAPTVDDSPILIGASGYGPATETFTGGIDDIRIYNSALSAAQISQMYAATNPGFCLSLGACTQTGAVEYDSVTGLLKWCSGSQWLPLAQP